MASSFGTLFRVTTFGESHGPALGVVVDGCPPGLAITPQMIQAELDRRRPGQSSIVTQRKEPDTVQILSGVQDGLSLGTPIALVVMNQNARSQDYEKLREAYRPSHADFTYAQKYGVRAWAGGGRASARETAARVAAGAVAKQLLAREGVEIIAWVEAVGALLAAVDPDAVTMAEVEANIVRCPDEALAQQMIELIEAVRKEGDSLGGVIGCVARGVPAGWGEPVFDKLEADLGKAVLSLPACKGFEVGSGFAGAAMRGSEHNDPFVPASDRLPDGRPRVETPTNRSGGIQGGISNGMPIVLRAAFKPTSTIMKEQDTVNEAHEAVKITGRGRHDPCVLPRAVPMVEAMTALVLADHCLRQRAMLTCS